MQAFRCGHASVAEPSRSISSSALARSGARWRWLSLYGQKQWCISSASEFSSGLAYKSVIERALAAAQAAVNLGVSATDVVQAAIEAMEVMDSMLRN